MTEAEIYEMLKIRYKPPEWILIRSVPSHVGGSLVGRRYADAIAISTYSSRGIRIHGFEIKTARGDFLKELRAPDKAEVIARRCHYWWLVAPAEILDASEIPPAWGWLCVQKSGIIKKKKAVENNDLQPLDYNFMAALMRATYSQSPTREMIEAARKNGYKEGYKDGKHDEQKGIAKETKDLKEKLGIYNRINNKVVFWGQGGLEACPSDMIDDVARMAEFISNSSARKKQLFWPIRNIENDIEDFTAALKILKKYRDSAGPFGKRN